MMSSWNQDDVEAGKKSSSKSSKKVSTCSTSGTQPNLTTIQEREVFVDALEHVVVGGGGGGGVVGGGVGGGGVGGGGDVVVGGGVYTNKAFDGSYEEIELKNKINSECNNNTKTECNKNTKTESINNTNTESINTESINNGSKVITKSNSMKKNGGQQIGRQISRRMSRKSIRSPEELSASLIWNNLTFEVSKKTWSVKGPKTEKLKILKGQNGEIVAGTLTALMGPSGAGKSTLLNCLTGRYVTGVKGSIQVTCRGPKAQATIAMVPQHDDLFRTFTVRETFVFASRMKNLGTDVDHEEEAILVMEYLNLESCADTKVTRCSGGQVKRVCIGVELISHPDILVLDEPTTGLDSSTAAQCIQLLRRLTDAKENPPAIVATIHQPNYKIFNEFTSVYLLSRNGQNIYFGSPLKIVDYFERFNLICPSYCNPADYAIEVAYGDYGQEVFASMESHQKAIVYDGKDRGKKYDLQKVVNKLRDKSMPTFKHAGLLLVRSWGNLFRDSNQFWLKNLQSLVIALIISYIWTYYVGEDDGCWESFSSPVNQSEIKNNLFKVDIKAAKDEYIKKISRMADNSAFIFACSIYTMLISLMTCVLSFPLETNVVIKEVSNNWYKVSSYFWAKTIADLPPMLISNFVLGAIVYPMTGQIPVLWRFLVFLSVICIVGEICQSIGMAVGIVISRDIVSASLLTVASAIPVIMFAGFLVRLESMPWYFRPISHISYIRYSFEASLVSIYGFGRCESTDGESFIDELLSAVDPIQVARNLWSSFNISYSDVRRYALILNVEEDCLGDVHNKTAEYLGVGAYAVTDDDTSDLFENSTTIGEDIMIKSPSKNPSYVLSYYNLDDSVIWYDFTALFIFVLVVKTIVYTLLKIKTKATK